jgi:hypothetical protein
MNHFALIYDKKEAQVSYNRPGKMIFGLWVLLVGARVKSAIHMHAEGMDDLTRPASLRLTRRCLNCIRYLPHLHGKLGAIPPDNQRLYA